MSWLDCHDTLDQTGTLLCRGRPAVKLVQPPDFAEPAHSDEFPNSVALDDGEVQRNTRAQKVPPTASQREDQSLSVPLQVRPFESEAGREDAHPLRHDPGNDPRGGMDYFLGRGTSDARAKPMFNILDALSGAVFSAMVTKGEDEYAVPVVAEALRFTGRASVILQCDQENPTKKLAELVRDTRQHDTVLLNTPVGSSASVGEQTKKLQNSVDP